MMFKIVNRMTPRYLKDIFSARPGASVCTLRTSQNDIAKPRARTDFYRTSFAFAGAKIWNALPNGMKTELSFGKFRNKLKSLDLSIGIKTSHFYCCIKLNINCILAVLLYFNFPYLVARLL